MLNAQALKAQTLIYVLDLWPDAPWIVINFWGHQSLPTVVERKGCKRGEVGSKGGWPTSSCLVFLLSQALTLYTTNAQLSALFWHISPHFRTHIPPPTQPHPLAVTSSCRARDPVFVDGVVTLVGAMGSEGHFPAAAYGYGPRSIPCCGT